MRREGVFVWSKRGETLIQKFFEPLLSALASAGQPEVSSFARVIFEFSFAKFVNDFVEIRSLEVELQEENSHKYTWAGGYASNPKGLACILLEVSFLQIKMSRTLVPECYDFQPPQDITNTTWFTIHPMYWAGLGLIGSI